MQNIQLEILGGAKRVGRLGILLRYMEESLLLDYGSEPSREFNMPKPVTTRDLKGVILSHAHIDHSGAIPYLYKNLNKPPLIATPPTIELSSLLIRDMMKVLKYNVPFTDSEVREMLYRSIPLTYEREAKLGENFIIELLDAGHIPGSASILVKVNGKKIWYTGDFNLRETRLHTPAQIVEDADIVLMEATYAYKNHPNREEEERRLVGRAREILEDGGTVLIPAFSVGRAQEVLSILTHHEIGEDIAVDGMAREATEIILRYSEYIKEPELLENAVRRARWIRSDKARRRLLRKPSIIIAPAGMLGGGWAEWYMKQLSGSDRNGIFLVSYQVPGTAGHKLLNEKRFRYNGKEIEVKAQVESFDFSAHNGRSELLHLINRLENPEKIILIHGEENHLKDFAELLREKGLEVEIGEEDKPYNIPN